MILSIEVIPGALLVAGVAAGGLLAIHRSAVKRAREETLFRAVLLVVGYIDDPAIRHEVLIRTVGAEHVETYMTAVNVAQATREAVADLDIAAARLKAGK